MTETNKRPVLVPLNTVAYSSAGSWVGWTRLGNVVALQHMGVRF